MPTYSKITFVKKITTVVNTSRPIVKDSCTILCWKDIIIRFAFGVRFVHI